MSLFLGELADMHGAASRFLALFLCFSASVEAHASDKIQSAGDILQFVLPAAAAGLTLGYEDGQGALEFGEFMRERYGWEYGVPAYALASFVGYSRVESRQHYPHDVIAGAAIGILSSYLFTKPYKGWNMELDADGKYYGFRLSRSF